MIKLKPFIFTGKDDFSDFANESIAQLQKEERANWYILLKVANRVFGGKPSKKFLLESKELIKSIGNDKFKKLVVRE